MKDRISYLGTDLDTVSDTEISLEIFPNRPDMLSVQGFARAFSSFVGIKTGLRRYSVTDSGQEVIIEKSVQQVRPFTACAIVKGIHYDDERIVEVIQIQEKLHVTYGRNRRKVAIGIYPFEKITPPIRFLAKRPQDIRFQPLEFPREITGLQILSQHPTGREYGHLLESCELFPVFEDSSGEVLSMPPIINSHKTGKITSETRDVFIECSGFDFPVLQKCLNMIVTAMADMGGTICSMTLRYPDQKVVTPNLEPSAMPVDSAYINKALGLQLSEARMKELLERMGYGTKSGTALVPAYRADVLHQRDLAEDIAIAYGYENFKSVIPNVATVGQEDPVEVFKNKVSDLLVGMRLLEVNTYNLTSRELQTKAMDCTIPVIELANSLSSEYGVLRAWTIPSLLEVLTHNKHNEYPQRIFCTGTVFRKDDAEETKIEEQEHLAVALCSEKVDFTEIRQLVEYLFSSFEIPCTIEELDHSSFIPGRVAKVLVHGQEVGYLGELHPSVLEHWSIDMPVAALELNISKLWKRISKKEL